MNRLEFLKTVGLLSAGFIAGGRANNLFLQSTDYSFREISQGLGVFNMKGGTIGWYYTKDMAVVIDSQFPDTAKVFLEQFKSKFGVTPSMLLNTHHHRDHTSGNKFLKDFVTGIVAQKNCPILQEKQNKGTENEKSQVYADTTFETDWKKSLTVETLTGYFFGPAHTGGDAIYHFENAGVIHLGDLVFNGVYPFIDTKGGGKIKDWIQVLDKIIKNFDKSTTFIFGHAKDFNSTTGNIDAVVSMRDYLEVLLETAVKAVKNGTPKEKFSEISPGEKYKRKEMWEGAFKMNLEAAVAEVETEN